MKKRKGKGKQRAFLRAFCLTVCGLWLLIGLIWADGNTRAVAGSALSPMAVLAEQGRELLWEEKQWEEWLPAPVLLWEQGGRAVGRWGAALFEKISRESERAGQGGEAVF